MIGINNIPIQWLLLTPHSTGSRPINVATTSIKMPVIPVKRKTSITIIAIVSLIIKAYGTFSKCLANIFPTFNVKKKKVPLPITKLLKDRHG